MYRRFFDKIALGYLLAVAVIVVIVILYASNAARSSQINDRAASLGNLATYIGNNYLAAYQHGDITDEQLQVILNDIDSTFDMRVWYIDTEGTLLFASVPEDTEGKIIYYYLPQNIHDLDDSQLLDATFYGTSDFYGIFPQQMLTYGTPLSGDSITESGTIILHTPLKYIMNITTNMFFHFLIPVLVIIVIFMLVLILLAQRILTPLNQLNNAAKQYAAGNFDVKTGITSNDEIGELASNMEYMASELSKLDEYRKAFIANISHDFRSPLTSIKGYIEAMLDGTIPKDNQERYLNIVLSETHRLTKLTASMLEMSKNDSYGLQLTFTSFNVMHIIQSTIDIFEGTCKKRFIVIKKKCNVKDPYVWADKTKIQQVIYNLVDNAIKFSPHGSTITISVNAMRDKLIVSVRDRGQGISKDQQSKVWDRFYKEDTSRGKDKQGSGLGLSIIREIIKAHGEEITLVSEPGKGSEFIFSLKRSEEADTNN